MFKKLLVALDLTEMDDFLLGYVHFLVKIFKTEKLYFIHNIKNYDLPEAIDALLAEAGKPLGQLVEEEVNEKVERVFGQSEVTRSTIVKQSDSTAHTVTKVSKELKVDTIVLGKKNAFRGSGIQVDKILRLTEQSVLLVPDWSAQSISKIVVPIDFSPHSQTVLNTVVEIEKQTGSDYLPLHVYQLPRLFFPYIPEENANQPLLESARKSYQKVIAKTEVAKPCVFLSGKDKGIAPTVYSFASRNHADFVIVGLKGSNKMRGFRLGSVAAKISQMEWHVPVLFVL